MWVLVAGLSLWQHLCTQTTCIAFITCNITCCIGHTSRFQKYCQSIPNYPKLCLCCFLGPSSLACHNFTKTHVPTTDHPVLRSSFKINLNFSTSPKSYLSARKKLIQILDTECAITTMANPNLTSGQTFPWPCVMKFYGDMCLQIVFDLLTGSINSVFKQQPVLQHVAVCYVECRDMSHLCLQHSVACKVIQETLPFSSQKCKLMWLPIGSSPIGVTWIVRDTLLGIDVVRLMINGRFICQRRHAQWQYCNCKSTNVLQLKQQRCLMVSGTW